MQLHRCQQHCQDEGPFNHYLKYSAGTGGLSETLLRSHKTSPSNRLAGLGRARATSLHNTHCRSVYLFLSFAIRTPG